MSPSVPIQVMYQMLVDFSHQAAMVKIEEKTAAEHIDPQYQKGCQQYAAYNGWNRRGQQAGQ